MMKKSFAIAVTSAWLLANLAFAQQAGTEGLPIKLGDSVAEVQAAFQTTLEPEPYESAVTKDGKVLRLRTKGVSALFGKEGVTTTIRLQAPFKGSVSGVRIGDGLATLRKQLGEPVKEPFVFGSHEAYLYYPDGTNSARFDINQSGEVETIFINRRSR